MRTGFVSTVLIATAIGSTTHAQCVENRLTSGEGFQAQFGRFVALDGDRLIVGAPWRPIDDLVVVGTAHLFEFDGSDWAEVFTIALDTPQSGAQVGRDVAIDGDWAAVGAPGLIAALPSTGQVLLFERVAGTWTDRGSVTAIDPADDDFGYALALQGTRLVVTANGEEPGSASVFDYDGTTWQPTQRIGGPGGGIGYYGSSVALDGDRIIVGAVDGIFGIDTPGFAYVYRLDGTWTFEATLEPPDGVTDDRFGHSVALDGTTALVGARNSEQAGVRTGAAYFFERTGTAWSAGELVLPKDVEFEDDFGNTVDVLGDVAYIGAPRDDDGGTGAGAIWRAERGESGWDLVEKMTGPGTSVNDRFGEDVALSRDRLLVGVFNDNFEGAAMVFTFDGPGPDCNDNGICDTDEISDGSVDDCNRNLVPDACDSDGDGDGIIDDCDNCPDHFNDDQADCNFDFIGDVCAIAEGISTDLNANDRPDDCESDCNGNAIPDDLDLVDGRSEDCNGDGIPDECPIGYIIDDGARNGAVSWAGQVFWLNPFVVEPGNGQITAIGINWGALASEDPATLLVYRDTDHDGDPSNAILVAAFPVQRTATSGNELAYYAIAPVAVGAVGDVFFVGAATEAGGFGSFAGVDFDAPPAPGWLGRADTGELDFEDLSNNLVPPTPLGELCCVDAGNWLVRAYTATQVDCACAADLDGDGSVGFADVLRILANWGPCPGCPADLDGNDDVGFTDLSTALGDWGGCG